MLNQKGRHPVPDLMPSLSCNLPVDRPSAIHHLKLLLQEGLPLVAQPYQHLAEQTGLTEAEVIRQLDHWCADNLIRRFGIVINHHRIGYTSNAMVVWQIPKSKIDQVGSDISATGLVSLCYQRQSGGSQWPYNLYCMLHGKHRQEVLQRLKKLQTSCHLEDTPHAVLFSTRQFKQCGGRYNGSIDSIRQERPCRQ
ncbi:Lrp/AsnC family transcriptional regulator [Hahella ganghwensis]|uniref:siroheme decarboxylase subunit beta n=1 Tax=Hahella ganghwensis TaxID=286420 RepID=UPI000361E3D1|nr:Lrp/AsnC family transcriptional regulator [Hahella ganghwensis]